MATQDSTASKIKFVPGGLSAITQRELKMIGDFRQTNDYGQAYISKMMEFLEEEFPRSVRVTPKKLHLIQGGAA